MGDMIPMVCAHPWFLQAGRLEYVQACGMNAIPIIALVV